MPRPLSLWDIGGCNCVLLFEVVGCNAGMAGVTVSAYTAAGGTLIDSAVTASDGHCKLRGLLDSGTYYFTVTGMSNRWAAFAQTITLPHGSFVLTPAAGFGCSNKCNEPLAATLHLTVTGVGTATLTYGGANVFWTGIMDAVNSFTLNANLILSWFKNGLLCTDCASFTFTCPPSFNFDCPSITCVNSYHATITE